MLVKDVLTNADSVDVSIDKTSLATINNQNGLFQIKFGNPNGCFYISSSSFLSSMVGKRIHLNCHVTAFGNRPFINASFFNDDGIIVDGCLPTNKKVLLQVDGTIKKINNRLAIEVAYKNAKNDEGVELSDFVFSQDTLDPLHGNLGGNKLFMMKRFSFQMESFIFLTSTHKVVVIDGGFDAETENLYNKLISLGGVVDSWYLSHYHNDHINALIGILTNPKYSAIHIKKLYYDFRVDSEIVSKFGDEDNHCLKDLDVALKGAPKMVEEVIIPHKGDLNVVDDGLSILVLNDAKYLAAPNMPNDSSILLKAITKQASILFCQDIGHYGDVLIQDPWFKKEISDCLFLQPGHHGQNGATKKFYKCCHASKIALFEAPLALFNDDLSGLNAGSGPWTSLETRDWLRELGIRYYFIEDEETIFD